MNQHIDLKLPEYGRRTSQQSPWPDLTRDQTVLERIHWSDGNGKFAALTSLGAIVQGHSLICPDLSVVQAVGARSMFDVNSKGMGSLFDEAIVKVRDLLQGTYRTPVVFFEHGNHKSTFYSSSCSTEYPHLHAVPMKATIADALTGTSWKGEMIKGYNTLSEFYRSRRGAGEYLLVSDNSATVAIWSGEDRIFQSQWLRHAAQRALRVPEDNWQYDLRVNEAIAEAAKIRSTRL